MGELNDAQYGYRGKLGLIVVGPNPTPLPDISRMVPPGVLVLETRFHMEPRVELDVVSELYKELPGAAATMAEVGADAIAFACTAGALSGGVGWDKEEIRQMESRSEGIPCTTTATAAYEAMVHLGWKKVVIATPYVEDINRLFHLFYTKSGFEVMKVKGLGIVSSYELAAIPPSKTYQLARDAFVPGADGIFIACTTFRATDVIEQLEQDCGVPVITANQATAWQLLRMIGCNEPVNGFGSLLRRDRKMETYRRPDYSRTLIAKDR